MTSIDCSMGHRSILVNMRPTVQRARSSRAATTRSLPGSRLRRCEPPPEARPRTRTRRRRNRRTRSCARRTGRWRTTSSPTRRSTPLLARGSATGACAAAWPRVLHLGRLRELRELSERTRGVGLYFSQAIIWVKEHPVLTRKDFMGNHEWCFYGWQRRCGPSVLRAQQRDRRLVGEEAQSHRNGPPHRKAGRAGRTRHPVRFSSQAKTSSICSADRDQRWSQPSRPGVART